MCTRTAASLRLVYLLSVFIRESFCICRQHLPAGAAHVS